MDIKWMLAYIFMSMGTAKHEKEARLVRISNVSLILGTRSA